MVDYLVPARIHGLNVIQGTFTHVPRGVILHGTESGSTTNTIAQEWLGTCRYVQAGALRYTEEGEPYYVAWQATGGEDIIGRHMRVDQWGWHAGNDSKTYLGYEFAHARTVLPITDAQINAFCWWFQHEVRVTYPMIPAIFPLHSETAQGQAIGKVDAFPRGSAAGKDLRERIAARLQAIGVT